MRDENSFKMWLFKVVIIVTQRLLHRRMPSNCLGCLLTSWIAKIVEYTVYRDW